MSNSVKVAVVTGAHPYDVVGFTHLFRSLPDVDAYVQHMEDFVTDPAGRRKEYDVVLFYTMETETPTGSGPWYSERTKAALESLGETEQGIFMMHHSLVAYPHWPLWRSVVGIRECGFNDYNFNQVVRIHVAQPEHPITQGLASWEMVDETYRMNEPEPDNEMLLTMEHPKSMEACAWTRTYRNARVFSLQSGHDNQTFVNDNFRTVVRRGIQWCARRI